MIHWKQIKDRKYAYSSKTLLINTLNNCRVNPSPAVYIRSFNRIPQSNSMHIMPRGHIETDPSTSRYFVTFSLEYLGAQWLSGRVLTRDREAAGLSLTGVTALWSLSKTHLSKLSTGSTQEDPSLFN